MASVTIEFIGQKRKVILSDPASQDPITRHEKLTALLTADERAQSLNDVPCAVVSVAAERSLGWSNSRWQEFTPQQQEALLDRICQESEGCHRVAIGDIEGDAQKWFEITLCLKGEMRVAFISDISALVHAENAQRSFLQTLSKTFAHLPTGLAIFDKTHQLALFNPALVDLTALSVEFLSARPTLFGFFDRLRDEQVMPEPKNYADWRGEINVMIASASGGLYSETWNLPNGLTYRVTGRPHPDGAVAFLIDDITDEISLTRRFRAQVSLRQAALDRLEGSMAVISSNNVVMFCNRSMVDFLGFDPDQNLIEMNMQDLFAQFKDHIEAPKFWTDAHTVISSGELHDPLEHQVVLENGQSCTCHIIPLAGGSVMIRLWLRETLPECEKSTEIA